jgi:hypothetical protein
MRHKVLRYKRGQRGGIDELCEYTEYGHKSSPLVLLLPKTVALTRSFSSGPCSAFQYRPRGRSEAGAVYWFVIDEVGLQNK